MNKYKKLLGTAAIVCAGTLLSSISNATLATIDLTVTKKVVGTDTGQVFEFDLYEPSLVPFPFSVKTFELVNDGSENLDPWLGFFLTETVGADQLIDIDIHGDAFLGVYHSVSWVGAANAPALPDWFESLVGAVPDNGAGGLCLAVHCSFEVEFTNLSAVPVPAAAWLFGSGLLGLAGVARRRRQQA